MKVLKKRSGVEEPFWRYGFVVLAIAETTALELLAPIFQEESPFLLFFVATGKSAWLGGWGSDLLAAVRAS